MVQVAAALADQQMAALRYGYQCSEGMTADYRIALTGTPVENHVGYLPDKRETKQYCNLTREQFTLYEAVLHDVETRLDDSRAWRAGARSSTRWSG